MIRATLITAVLCVAPIAAAQENPFTNQGESVRPAPVPPVRITIPPPGEEGAGQATAPDPQAQPAPRAPAPMIRISKRDCRRLVVTHKPRADVAHRPGFDADGAPVAKVDNAQEYARLTPDVIEFALRFDVLRNTGLDPEDFGETAATVGIVKYDILKGRLTVNGEPLTDPLADAIEEKCRAAGYLD